MQRAGDMNKKTLIIVGLLLVAVCFVTAITRGTSFTLRVPVGASETDADAFQVEIERGNEIIRLTDKTLKDGTLYLTFRSVSCGKDFVTVSDADRFILLEAFYVHRFGIITVNSYFGRSEGGVVFPAAVSIYLALILWAVISRYRRDIKDSLYQYSNIRNAGWIIFISLMLASQLPYLLSNNSLTETVNRSLESASSVAYIVFPVAFIVSVLVTISNVQLMRKEGRSLRNMLGILLGLLTCFATVFPYLLSEYLQRTTIVDVHNEQGMAMYVEKALTNTILVTVSYLECILLGTVILGVKAAKKIPAFDKDFILILGCQIQKDGTLTPLLKGRTDSALAFARMQKEATGRDVVFVPSGGKGADEIMPEAQAVKNYLSDAGVPAEKILLEDRSVNTDENFKYAMELIRGNTDIAEPKIAFSTTNYHVFRSGALALQQGVRAEGIGSSTRSYFWINAFVREFIATVYAERKKHLKVIASLVLLTLCTVLVVYLSNNL